MRRRQLTKQNAKKRGYAALGTGATTAVLCMVMSPYILIAGGPLTLWLTYRWLRYRAKWGLRF